MEIGTSVPDGETAALNFFDRQEQVEQTPNRLPASAEQGASSRGQPNFPPNSIARPPLHLGL